MFFRKHFQNKMMIYVTHATHLNFTCFEQKSKLKLLKVKEYKKLAAFFTAILYDLYFSLHRLDICSRSATKIFFLG